MSDPISRLDQFRADTPGAPMKSAAEVRRRGDQIRRRHRAAVTAGAVAVAAAVAGPIIFLSAGLGQRATDPEPAPAPTETPSTVTPTPSSPPAASDLTRTHLPTEDDLVTADPYPRWTQEQTYDGEGRDDHNECLTESLADAGALATFRRDFVPERGHQLSGSAGTLKAVVAEFGSAGDAEKVRAELSEAATSCPGVSGAKTAGYLPVEGKAVTAGDVDVVTYLPEDEPDNARREVATAVVTVEDRLLVLTRQRGVQDYVSPTDLRDSAARAAHRLAGSPLPPATTPGSASSSPSSSSSAAAPLLSEAHLVEAGSLPALPLEGESSAVWQQVAPQPTPTLYCQGAWLSSLKAADSVSREFRLENPGEIGKVNVTVLEFATKKSADTAYDTVHGWLDACPASLADAKRFTAGPVRSIETDTSPAIDRAAQTLAEYAGDCGGLDCDATWYDHQTVVQIGTRLVLVTHAEAGGPCPPTRACPPEEASDYTEWDNRVARTVKATVDRAVRDLR
ncbi:HPt (histidine-containing phosphotransfer) domain-containing protein [Nocardioides luteus]|uniref:PknH-like extracellular domain-containing protein n=1 Tax=Nocardioides luteus TaxID=1844 RepID=A0ABQ5SUF0_9ACTN|nr:hypothetical protein [Nocardioides luteus]MDR7309024.1 HPt (histidine-containing phosphotransfer) domain-containing protein [Nocardioides luteus]GGR50299.1 hypothetical protein GCM10010197_15460 [Nocardioides luteus]GLJ67431.1 hypothetical protein GCM10017579_14670 [Nocardioides luteus]